MTDDLLEILEFFERYEKAGTLNKKYSEVIRNLYKEKEYYKKLYIENYYTANEDCILKSKAEEMLEEIDEELEEMKVDNMYGRYDDYGGKRKFNEQFSYKFGGKEVLQELLED